jgi:hypothetical protein
MICIEDIPSCRRRDGRLIRPFESTPYVTEFGDMPIWIFEATDVGASPPEYGLLAVDQHGFVSVFHGGSSPILHATAFARWWPSLPEAQEQARLLHVESERQADWQLRLAPQPL